MKMACWYNYKRYIITTLWTVVVVVLLCVIQTTTARTPCRDAHHSTNEYPCWPSSIPGRQVAPQCHPDGSVTAKISCPPGTKLPRGYATSFHGNCTAEQTCLRIPPCIYVYTCEDSNPCAGGLHRLRQFASPNPYQFVICGPKGQCQQIPCLGDLLYDGESKICVWRT